jgi:hypothetical protein
MPLPNSNNYNKTCNVCFKFKLEIPVANVVHQEQTQQSINIDHINHCQLTRTYQFCIISYGVESIAHYDLMIGDG